MKGYDIEYPPKKLEMQKENMRKRIVIVECYSSAVNYIHDIREVILQEYISGDEYAEKP